MAVVLVTGGTGYVASHACKALAEAERTPVTFDNFSTGWRDAVRFGPLVEGDLLDPDRIDTAMAGHKPSAVMHFAALSTVGESATDPGLYWKNKVAGSLNLLRAVQARGIRALVFSSTCAIYGIAMGNTVTEEDPQRPVSVYGPTKLAVETMLDELEEAHGLRPVCFRYFNAAGADPERLVGEDHLPETHLIPLMLDAASGRRDAITVFGTDYPTADGTCIRDYIHVSDLAGAHVLGLEWLLAGGECLKLSLGSGSGYSVRDVIRTAGQVTGAETPVVEGDRREGDPHRLVSGSTKAGELLGWTCQRDDLAVMIGDACASHHTGGYAH